MIKYLKNNKSVSLIEPLKYQDLISVMKDCFLVLTDSGGLQEEAPSLDKPLLVLRESTEREEIIDVGGSILVGTDTNLIVKEVSSLIKNEAKYKRMSKAINPYGDGRSSKKIKKLIMKFLNI